MEVPAQSSNPVYWPHSGRSYWKASSEPELGITVNTGIERVFLQLIKFLSKTSSFLKYNQYVFNHKYSKIVQIPTNIFSQDYKKGFFLSPSPLYAPYKTLPEQLKGTPFHSIHFFPRSKMKKIHSFTQHCKYQMKKQCTYCLCNYFFCLCITRGH